MNQDWAFRVTPGDLHMSEYMPTPGQADLLQISAQLVERLHADSSSR